MGVQIRPSTSGSDILVCSTVECCLLRLISFQTLLCLPFDPSRQGIPFSILSISHDLKIRIHWSSHKMHSPGDVFPPSPSISFSRPSNLVIIHVGFFFFLQKVWVSDVVITFNMRVSVCAWPSCSALMWLTDDSYPLSHSPPHRSGFFFFKCSQQSEVPKALRRS